MRGLLGLLLPVIVTGLSIAADSWWTDRDKGWFFYNEKRPVHRNESEIKEEKPREEKKLFTQIMQEKGSELLSRAIEEPTEENVERYMRFNKAMLTLADNFARVWQKVLMKNPDLMFPGSLSYSFGDIAAQISELSRKAGLFFFYSSSCDMCTAQALELKEFERKYGMTVFPVTLDEPLPEYPDSVRDNGISRVLGLRRTPSIYIAFPGENRIELIAEGYIDVFDLERRLYYYAQPTEDVRDILDSLAGGSNPARVPGRR